MSGENLGDTLPLEAVVEPRASFPNSYPGVMRMEYRRRSLEKPWMTRADVRTCLLEIITPVP